MSTHQERITTLLTHLRHEITAGILEGEIDGLSFWFYVSDAPGSATFCELRTSRVPRFDLGAADLTPRLSFAPQNVDRSGLSRRRLSAQARAAAT
jgi:hypothetical protein